MNIDLLLSILAGLLLLIGFLGTFIPVLPGAPLAWAGLLLSYFSSYNNISLICLFITCFFAIAVSILDNFTPILMTKKFGGSKKAITGSTIGLIVGFYRPHWNNCRPICWSFNWRTNKQQRQLGWSF